jgi:hypothetical protein
MEYREANDYFMSKIKDLPLGKEMLVDYFNKITSRLTTQLALRPEDFTFASTEALYSKYQQRMEDDIVLDEDTNKIRDWKIYALDLFDQLNREKFSNSLNSEIGDSLIYMILTKAKKAVISKALLRYEQQAAREPLKTGGLASRIPPGSNKITNYRIDQIFTEAEKDSSSYSLIAVGKYIGPLTEEHPRSVVFKISYLYADDKLSEIRERVNKNIPSLSHRQEIMQHVEKLQALKYESCVYEHVSKLPDTTNTVLHVGTFYNALQVAASKEILKTLKRQLGKLIESLHEQLSAFTDGLIKDIYAERLQVLITEKQPNVKSLFDFLTSSNVSTNDLKGIVIQVLAALEMLESVDVRHNDLHLNNMLIALVSKPYQAQYTIGSSSFTVLIKYRVLLFDWDLSYAPSWCGNNNGLDGDICDDTGRCNEEGSFKFDTVMFLYAVSRNVFDSEFKTFFSRVIDSKLKNADFSTECKGRKCGLLKSTRGKTYEFPEDVPSIQTIAMDAYFNELRIKA